TMAEAFVRYEMNRLRELLESEETINEGLECMECMGFSYHMHLLKETGLKKVVRALRSHPTHGRSAEKLVIEWKHMPELEVPTATTVATLSDAGYGSAASSSEGEPEKAAKRKSDTPVAAPSDAGYGNGASSSEGEPKKAPKRKSDTPVAAPPVKREARKAPAPVNPDPFAGMVFTKVADVKESSRIRREEERKAQKSVKEDVKEEK
ncbi:hypothetical protein PFISCL1PPCAC_22919, partial [Pristionchus fissidentatus]